MVGLTARKYAKALFDLAIEKNELGAFYDGAVFAAALFKEGGEFASAMAHPRIGREEKQALAKSAFAGKAPDDFCALFALLLRKNRVGEAGEIFRRFIALTRAHRKIATARVYSAVPLDAARTAQIQKTLSAKMGKTIEIEATVDPALIAGLRINVDGWEIDGTVKKGLEDLKKRMIMAKA